MSWIEEEVTLAEFSERFLNNSDFKTEVAYDLSDSNIEVLTENESGDSIYKPILPYLVKGGVDSYYTDGKIKVSANHRFIENGITIFAKNHIDFTEINEPLDIVDIEVDELHSYLSNGRLNHNTTSGGKALAFHASVRLRLKNMGQIKIGTKPNERVIGMKVRCQVVKNRMGPPLRAADFDIFFDSGIDNFGSWLKVMKDHKLVTQGGAWYTYVDTDTGEEHKFQAKEWNELMETNLDLQLQVYQRICEAMVVSYKVKASYNPEDLTVDTKGAGIDE